MEEPLEESKKLIFTLKIKWILFILILDCMILNILIPIQEKIVKNLSHPHQASPKQYEKNLIEIVEKLKQTGAKLIFATTTPYPDKLGKQMRSPGMQKYIMKSHLG